jgi:hypothetical protein
MPSPFIYGGIIHRKKVEGVVAGGRNEFHPTNIAHAFEYEAFEGSGRNEFRPYNDGVSS